MKRASFVVVLLLMAGAAHAQPMMPPQQQPSPEAQALGGKLMEEINSNVSLRTELIKAQAQLKSLQEENTKLRASTKVEAPKVPEPAHKP